MIPIKARLARLKATYLRFISNCCNDLNICHKTGDLMSFNVENYGIGIGYGIEKWLEESTGNVMSFIVSTCFGGVVEQGLANTFNLATLHHGTNVISWTAIHLFGTMPAAGGSFFGGDADVSSYADQNIGNTFFADSSTVSSMYKLKSNINLLKGIKFPAPIAKSISEIISIVIPTIRVHFPDEIIENRDLFKIDTSHQEGGSFYTNRWISPLNMGAIGSIWQSCTYKTPIRMLKNPRRVLTGLAQVSISAFAINAVAVYGPASLTNYQISMIAGLIMGMI